MSDRRLIEESFPLKEVSEHSRHESTVNSVKISSLHLWPARRPLAASRAATIAALMPDPGDEAGRQKLNKRIASITQWKTENGPALDYFREEIRKAYGGRPPRVLDMFAGGGAIPLEAMRLGCDVTAIDYNPVAWFILKCTLEFPQRLAGQTWPLPADALDKLEQKLPLTEEEDDDSWDSESEELETREGGRADEAEEADSPAWQPQLFRTNDEPAGNLADHVRYWGQWVLEQARAELEPYYPTIDRQPTVAYLWARTVPCPDPRCGTIVPLLKTLWLSKKLEKTLPDTPENRARPDFLRVKTTKNTSSVVINGRRALRLIPPKKGEGGQVRFGIWNPGPKDKVPEGTMSGAKSQCPTCGINLTPDYIKKCGFEETLKAQMTSVAVETGYGKDYRLPTAIEQSRAIEASSALSNAARQIPFGLPVELQEKNPRTLIVQLYGMRSWASLFTSRQLLTVSVLVKWTRNTISEMSRLNYPQEWREAVISYLCAVLDRFADHNSTLVKWMSKEEAIDHTYARNVLQITWDFSEAGAINDVRGSYQFALTRIVKALRLALSSASPLDNCVTVLREDAQRLHLVPESYFDAIITDPPYYSAIPYSDLSDFFYVWLRRTLIDIYPDAFNNQTTPKNQELALRLPHEDIPDEHTPKWYESGMATAFHRAWETLSPDGRMVIVFAHKDPDAWETLVTAMIEAGFVVTASWPIDTEKRNRSRAMNSATLSSSVWLVCRKRPVNAGIGRYRAVRKAMEERVTERLRYFWDSGLSGPDFVWAAIGPALESYSAYAEVRRLDGSPFTVSDFLKDARRLVADFALGQILRGHSTEGLDEWTRYYLMHRNSFGLDEAPVGECILLSQGYGLDLNDLRSDRGFIVKASGSSVRLAKWEERTRDDLGEPHPSGGLPMIDMLHRLMRLWAAGNLDTLNGYAAEKGLRQNDLFWAVAQAILEMAPAQSRERTLLEALVAWGRGRAAAEQPTQPSLIG